LKVWLRNSPIHRKLFIT